MLNQNLTLLGISLLAGLSFFLVGLLMLTDSLKRIGGTSMRTLLQKTTSNRFKGVFAGALVTALVQSSSVSTVLVVGFISAGMMELRQAAGFIMGANIGTTITAQIISFNVTTAALVLVASGGLGYALISGDRRRTAFFILFALGLIFYGMTLMSEAMQPLRHHDPFLQVMQSFQSPIVGIVVGAVFTALLQSSSATTAIIIVFASKGLIGLQEGIILSLGANIGTCITAWIAAMGKATDAKRAALIHVLFNVAGVAVWIGFTDELAMLATWLTREAGLSGIRDVGILIPREIANAHTIFNVVNTLLFIGLTGPIVRLTRRLFRDSPGLPTTSIIPKYLDDTLIDTPTLALDRVSLEIGRMGSRVHAMIERAALMVTQPGARHEELKMLDDELDGLYLNINAYLGRVSAGPLSTDEAKRVRLYVGASTLFENMGDEIETRFADADMDRSRLREEFSPSTADHLSAVLRTVNGHLDDVMDALEHRDVQKAKRVQRTKSSLRLELDALRSHLLTQLSASSGERVRILGLESDAVEVAKRLNDQIRLVAKLVIDTKATRTGS